MKSIEYKMDRQTENAMEAAHSRDPSQAARQLAELARISESAAHNLRQRVWEAFRSVDALGMAPEHFYLEDYQQVGITDTRYGLRIEMEGMLPFATKGTTYYLHEKLESALKRYAAEKGLALPLFREKSAVLFIHHYDGRGRRYRNRQLRDYDNVEHRAILNTLARFCLWDDGPQNVISMDLLRISDRDYTEIQVMDIPQFQQYVLSEDIGNS